MPLTARSTAATLAALGVLALSASAADAATRDVCPDGCTYSTINAGVAAAAPGDTVDVGPGTYAEDVTIGKAITLQGAGPESTTIVGPIGGSSVTVLVSAPGVTVTGFTVTRAGNTVADWNDPGLNVIGVGVQAGGQATITQNVMTGNRNGVDINNASGSTVTANRIVDNRTGIILRNTTDDTTITHNWIEDNWTLGVLFLDSTVTSRALDSDFTDNKISGNWYGQVVDRQVAITPGTNLKDFSANYLGANQTMTTTNSAEPGYAAQIPEQFGGSATPPADAAPAVMGPGMANVDATPMLEDGGDVGPGPGFQGSLEDLRVLSQGAQTGSVGRIQEAVALVDDEGDGDIRVNAGSYPLTAPIAIGKPLSLHGPNAFTDPSDPSDRTQPNPARGPEATLSVTGGTRAITVGSPGVSVAGFEITDGATAAANVNEPLIGAGGNFGGDASGVTLENLLFTGITRTAVYFNGPTRMSGGSVYSTRVQSATRPATGCAGTVAPSNCGHQLFNLWKTDGVSFEDNVVVGDGAGDRVRVLNVNDVDGADIRENTIDFTCTYTCFAIAGAADDVVVTRNAISTTAGNSIQLHSTWTAGKVDVTGNEIDSPNDYAVVVDGASADLSQVKVNRNALLGPAFRNASSATLDGQCNWFGHPNGVGPGGVDGPVDISPWLRSADLEGECAVDWTADPAGWSFGLVAMGESPEQEVTITNDGGGLLTISELDRQGAGRSQYAITTDWCTGATLAPSEECTFTVTFTPQQLGSSNPSIVVRTDAGNQRLEMQAHVVKALRVFPTSHDFGTWGVGSNSDPRQISVFNDSNSPMTLGTLRKEGAGKSQFHVISDSCSGQEVAAHGVCTFQVRFTPAGVGSWSPVFSIDGPSSSISVGVQGTGVKPLTVAPNPHGFGTVPRSTSAQQTFTVTNNAASDTTIGTFVKSGTGKSLFGVGSNGCTGTTLTHGQSCTFTVTFSPLAAGTWTPEIVIPGTQGNAKLELSGSGS